MSGFPLYLIRRAIKNVNACQSCLSVKAAADLIHNKNVGTINPIVDIDVVGQLKVSPTLEPFIKKRRKST